MSLTSQIAKPGSAFMQFALSEIPDSSMITSDKRGGHRRAIEVPIDTSSDKRPDWALIGTAIDFRLRLAFAPNQPIPPSARRGFRRLCRSLSAEGTNLLVDIESELQQLLSFDCSPGAGSIELPNPASEDRLLRLCVVLAWLDQIHRGQPGIEELTPILDVERSIRSIEDVAAAVPAFVVQQLRGQVQVANTGLTPLLTPAAQKVVSGPRFDGADKIGGADADIISDGTLIDFKSSRLATTIGKREVYQLAGYVLFDFDNEYEITSLGIYWTRHGISRIFTVEEYFELLGATQPIVELRKMLQASLGKGRPKLRPEDRLAYFESLRPLFEDDKRRRAARP